MSVPEYSQTDEHLRLMWRKSLNEANLRSLAAEYLRGHIDECTTDAFLEYKKRFPDEIGSPAVVGNSQGARSSR